MDSPSTMAALVKCNGTFIEGKFFTGITADRWGHLFQVDDINKAVKMYTVEGTELGVLQIKKDDFPYPWQISWCRETSSLILVHAKGWQRIISVITVRYPQ